MSGLPEVMNHLLESGGSPLDPVKSSFTSVQADADDELEREAELELELETED
jgi:hypothetical protein